MESKEVKLPAVLKDQVENSGMEMNVAQTIASHYAPFMSQSQEQAELLKGLNAENPEDVSKAKRIRIDLGKICSSVATQKKNDKDMLLIHTRYIDGLFKAVEGFARLTQKEAEAIEKHAERQEELRLDEQEIERKKALEKYDVDPDTVGEVRTMSTEVWSIYIKGVGDQYAERKAAEAQAEKERIEQEKKQKVYTEREKQLLVYDAFNVEYELSLDSTDDEFKAMLSKCETAKKKAIEDQKQKDIENEKLKKQAREKEALIAKEKAQAAEKLAEEAAARKKAEDEAQALRKTEEARKQKEAAEQLQKEKEAAARMKSPDIDKLKLLIDEIVFPEIELKDENVISVCSDIRVKFDGFKKWAKEQLDNLKTKNHE